jgi:ribosome-binding factor A
MQGKRLDRVNQLVKEEISLLLQRGLKDPGLGFVSVTEVEVSKDLRTARVYVSVLGPEEQWRTSLAALDRARGYVRSWLTPRLRLRVVPQITFHPDRSMAHAAHIQRLLAELREPDVPGPDGPAAPAARPGPGSPPPGSS